jgi:hypothetical protein
MGTAALRSLLVVAVAVAGSRSSPSSDLVAVVRGL